MRSLMFYCRTSLVRKKHLSTLEFGVGQLIQIIEVHASTIVYNTFMLSDSGTYSVHEQGNLNALYHIFGFLDKKITK
jgi:hypothetical protein